MKERLVYVDQMKGIAILLVVMGHLIGYNVGYNETVEFIYSFHMPLFFMISGYLGHKTTHVVSLKTYGKFLKKKFIGLMLPFLFWSMIAEKYFLQSEWHIPALSDISEAILVWNRLWFLKTLFLILVIYGLTHWMAKSFVRQKLSFVMDILFFLLVASGLSVGILAIDTHFFSSLLLYTAFFYAGMFIAKYNRIEQLTMHQYTFAGSVILLLIWVGHWNLEGVVIDKIYKCIISPMAYITILNICRRISWNPKVSDQFVLFGKYSLVIYIVHFYFVTFMNYEPVIDMDLNPFILMILSVVVSVMIAYLCIGFAKLMECSHILNFLMFGKQMPAKTTHT